MLFSVSSVLLIMDRRNFLKLATSTGVATILVPLQNLLARNSRKGNSEIICKAYSEPSKAEGLPDLVGVKDGSPAQMFEIGIRALGGMERFVKKGQTVLVKPNMGWNKTPSSGANTPISTGVNSAPVAINRRVSVAAI